MNNDNLKKIILNLAKSAIESYVKNASIFENNKEEPYLLKPAAAFVCLKLGYDLRGCMGTIKPQHENLAKEITNNAIMAATEDYRFTPIQAEELPHLNYSVDVLSKLSLISSTKELNPKEFGVLVKAGVKSGLLLPDLEGVDTVKKQLFIAKQKAGINNDKHLKIYKFKVRRF